MKRRAFIGGLATGAAIMAMAGPAACQLGPEGSAGVKALIEAYEAAWNSADLDAMAALYHPDVHWVNVKGMHWRGFKEVDHAHRVYFDLMFRGVRQEIEAIERLTPVGPDVAVAVVVWRVGPYRTPSGQQLPAGRTRMTLVLNRVAGQWKILHGHNLDIDEAAQQFDPVNAAPP